MVLGWTDGLPTELVERDPEVALTRAVLLVMSGRALAAEDLAGRIQRAHVLSPYHQAIADTVLCLLVHHHAPPATVVAASDRILGSIPAWVDEPPTILPAMSSPEALRTVAQTCAARAEMLRGRLDEAEARLAAAWEGCHYPPFIIHVQGTMAMCAALAGRLRDAEAEKRRPEP